MKWLLGLFISVFLLTAQKGSSSSYAFFESAENQCFGYNYTSKVYVNNSFTAISQQEVSVSNSSNKNQLPQKNKKKNKKGFKSVYSCLSINYTHFLPVSDGKNHFFKQNSLIDCDFFGNGKRGPPSLLV